MVRTSSLERDFHTTLNTIFQSCFADNEFEQDFLHQKLISEITHHPSQNISLKPIVTDWIYDENQSIPYSTHYPTKKGIYCRMKFYKMKESDDGKQVKLISVTENQVRFLQNKYYKFILFDNRNIGYNHHLIIQ